MVQVSILHPFTRISDSQLPAQPLGLELMVALARILPAQVAADGSRRCIRCEKNAPTTVGGYDLSTDRARFKLSRLGWLGDRVTNHESLLALRWL